MIVPETAQTQVDAHTHKRQAPSSQSSEGERGLPRHHIKEWGKNAPLKRHPSKERRSTPFCRIEESSLAAGSRS
ncbi:hypothetical protein Taro_046208 [Colocasia esculenta]|uniref:Uncharacterized protein n=1 Tax=Colocasia esculenta TaxID=4460 RepID=A0A843X5U0_COLES|nr:hypothetical protein [Colocasia esculenta]